MDESTGSYRGWEVTKDCRCCGIQGIRRLHADNDSQVWALCPVCDLVPNPAMTSE
jgi:hypothetical protein